MSTAIKVLFVGAIILGGLYAISNPDEIYALFEDKPNVKFYETPSVDENIIKVNYATNLSVSARNFENESVSNVQVKLLVTNGGNWEEHLKFDSTTILSDTLSPGVATDKKLIPITATNLSGIETPFTLKAELYADGILTDSHTFRITIR